MPHSLASQHTARPRARNPSGGSRTSSPARSVRSEAPRSIAGSNISSNQRSKSKASTYPKKGSTLGNIELSPGEEEHLQNVLARFDQFRLKEDLRIRQLRDQLVEKQKIRIRNAEASGDGHCYSCGRLFMAVFSPATECYICRHEFCRSCLEKMPKSKDAICKFCRFESVHRGQLGVWFTEELKQARAAGRVRGVSGPEALRSSLLRIKRESRANSLAEHLQGQFNFDGASMPLDETKSDYTHPMTESWVQQVKTPRGRRTSSASIERTESIPPPRSAGSEISLPKSISTSSVENLQQSHRSDNRSTISTGRKFSGSLSDIRDVGRHGVHKPRLTSEAGSKSTLSLASGSRAGSMTSVHSENESSYTHGIRVTGDLRLDIQYDHPSSTLRISVKQARDLPAVDKKQQSCNPYVKSYLLPDKTKGSKRKTSVRKHNRNPAFEEELKYRILYSELSERSLQIAVWHKPSVGSSLFLGEVIIPFHDMQFDAGAQWYPLSERRENALTAGLQIYRGEILVALKLVIGGTLGAQSELHVWIKSAKGLSASTTGSSKSSSIDPYAKVYLLPGRDKSTKRKTKTLKKVTNPDWNTNFVYKNLDRNEIPQMGVEISVWDHDRLSSNDFLGGCRLNNGSMQHRWMDAKGTEQSVWMAMLSRPQTWFEGLIRLRSNLD